MARIRTIESAYREIISQDPNTSITKYYIREIVINGKIPFRKSGKRYLFDMDTLNDYLKGGFVNE